MARTHNNNAFGEAHHSGRVSSIRLRFLDSLHERLRRDLDSLLPHDDVYYVFTDGNEFNWYNAVHEINKLKPYCGSRLIKENSYVRDRGRLEHNGGRNIQPIPYLIIFKG